MGAEQQADREPSAALQKSLEYYDQAILKNAGDISLLQLKGLALFELGRYDEGIEAYDQALKEFPGLEISNLDRRLDRQGRCLAGTGQE